MEMETSCVWVTFRSYRGKSGPVNLEHTLNHVDVQHQRISILLTKY